VQGKTSQFNWSARAKAAISVAYLGSPTFALPKLAFLARHGLAATAFLNPTELLDEPEKWRTVTLLGHEVGGGSLLGLTHDGRLTNWTRQMILDDLVLSEDLYDSLSPSRFSRPIAAPGPILECADGSYEDLLTNRAAFVLTSHRGVNHPVFCHPGRLSHLAVGEAPLSQTWSEVDEGIQKGAWVIVSFDLGQPAQAELHDEVIEELARRSQGLLTGCVGEVGAEILDFRFKLSLR
jgi:hypothetical protein